MKSTIIITVLAIIAFCSCTKKETQAPSPTPPPDLGESFQVTCDIASLERSPYYNWHKRSVFYTLYNGQAYHISFDASGMDANAHVTIENEDLITDLSEYREGPVLECYKFTHCASTKFNIEFFNGNRASITLSPNASYTVTETIENVELYKSNVDSLRTKGRRDVKASLHDIVDGDFLNAGNQPQPIQVRIKAADWMPEK